MAGIHLTVTKWEYDKQGPETSSFELAADGSWTRPEPSRAALTLEEVLFIQPSDALRVESGGLVKADVIAAALPTGDEYTYMELSMKTGEDLFDDYAYGGTAVAIDGQRWAAFQIVDGTERSFSWLPCDHDEFEYGKLIPLARRSIGNASGIEMDSRTSGTFAWSLIEIDDDLVCFVTDPDEDVTTCEVVRRKGRTDRQLAEEFMDHIDWEPVSLAVERALAQGGSFEGLASELDPDQSETCEVSASVYLRYPET